MSIDLIAKIAPKNDAFTGMVDADQVLGGGGAGTLPDACVAASNITQHLLDEDDMASDSATKAPTQQSTKAYVLAHAGGAATIQHRWDANGPFQVGTLVDGAYISDSAWSITGIWIYRGTAGSASSTIVDINKNGTTMYTTQANRPTIAYNDGDSKVDATLPDVVTIAAGDIITLDRKSVV
jgi:hypothetical protein